MMDLLKRSDIERAREELRARRAATLKRQSEELERLAAESAEIELLGRLAGGFFQKYKRPPAPVATLSVPVARPPASVEEPPGPGEEPPAPVGKPPASVEPAVKRPTKPPAIPHNRINEPARAADRRQLAGTNFELFSRAVFKSSY